MRFSRHVRLSERHAAAQDQHGYLQPEFIHCAIEIFGKLRIVAGRRAVYDNGSLERLELNVMVQPGCDGGRRLTVAHRCHRVEAFEQLRLDRRPSQINPLTVEKKVRLGAMFDPECQAKSATDTVLGGQGNAGSGMKRPSIGTGSQKQSGTVRAIYLMTNSVQDRCRTMVPASQLPFDHSFHHKVRP